MADWRGGREEDCAPTECGCCGKSSAELRRCSRCKAVAYCSKECQRRDWKTRHYKQCKDENRHRKECKDGAEVREGTSGTGIVQQLKAVKREEWALDSLQESTTMGLYKGKLITSGFKVPGHIPCPVVVYDMKTGKKETTFCAAPDDKIVVGLSTMTVKGKGFVLLSLFRTEENHDFQLWPYPNTGTQPLYTFHCTCHITVHAVIDNTLLVVEDGGRDLKDKYVSPTIHQIDVSCIPCGRKGKPITPDLEVDSNINRMCAFKTNGAKRILLVYNVMKWYTFKSHNLIAKGLKHPTELGNSIIKCFTYEGDLLWKLADYSVVTAVDAVAVCTNDDGQVFVSDRLNKQVVAVHHDDAGVKAVEQLLTTPGKTANVEWQQETNQLVVMYDNAEGTRTMAARYDVRQPKIAQDDRSLAPQTTPTKEVAAGARNKIQDNLGKAGLVQEEGAPTDKVDQLPTEKSSDDRKDAQAECARSCSYCGITDKQLAKCRECRVARYCGKDCQRKDWKTKHRAECKELKESKSESQKSNISDVFGAKPSGSPWRFCENFDTAKTCVFEDKLIISWQSKGRLSNSVLIYDIKTGEKVATVCTAAKKEVSNVSFIRIDGAQYIVVALAHEQLQLWPYPRLQSEPIYTFRTNFCSPSHTFHDGKLLVPDAMIYVIREFDAGTIPFKSTGGQIPTDLVVGSCVQKLCVFRNGGKRNIVVMFNDLVDWLSSSVAFVGGEAVTASIKGTVVKCFDYSGSAMWELSKYRLDGIRISPSDISANDRGQVFVADGFNRRVVVLTCGRVLQSVRTLVAPPGSVRKIEWCADLGKLLVVYKTSDATEIRAACFDTDETAS